MFDLSGKVAVVTGASSGLGKAMAELFTERGAKVVIADIDDQRGKEVVRSIGEKGGEAAFVHTDVSRLSDLQTMVDEAMERFRRLDILVNNAGIVVLKGSLDIDEQEYQHLMDVNLKSMLFGSRLAAEKMRGHAGAIVNIASVHAVAPAPVVVAYSVSKAGVVSLTQALAMEYAPMGIRVNSILPGAIDTPMNDGLPVSAEEKAAIRERNTKRTLLKRLGRPIDIAYGALYLVSDEAAYVTGASLLIDGGFVLAT